MTQGKAIFNIKGMAKAIRYTEYSDIYSALSEIVDNSLEAKATDILVVCYERLNSEGSKEVGDIAIMDNGTGMSESILHGCLVFGESSPKSSVGMGKFGVGLGQASMFAAPRVEVYSWQNNGPIKMVFLDSNLMAEGKQTEIEYPITQELPQWIKGFMKVKLLDVGDYNFTQSGTIVVWKNVDHAQGLLSRFYANLSTELGRRFRNYIAAGCKIGITNTQHAPRELVLPIDPMHLMPTSRFLADPRPNYLGCLSDTVSGEPLFEPFISDLTPGGECKLDLRLERNRVPFVATVTIRASVIKSKFYYEAARALQKQNPGDTPIGKLTRRYERVSVLRVGREIQFDRFDLYESINEPTNRWWRIEISFMPELDEFFSLSNNKQKVEIKTQYRQEKGKNPYDDETLEAVAWRRILDSFDKIKKSMVNRNSQIAKGAKSLGFPSKTPVKPEIPKSSSPYIPISKVPFPKIGDDQKSSESILIDALREYTDCKIEKAKNDDFLYFSRISNNYKCYINQNHELFKKLLKQDNVLLGVELVLTALANVRGNFKLYDENQIIETLMKYLNEEFNFIDDISEDEND